MYGQLFFLLMYVIQPCCICHPSNSTVSEDAGIAPRTVATLALTAYLLSNKQKCTIFTRQKRLQSMGSLIDWKRRKWDIQTLYNHLARSHLRKTVAFLVDKTNIMFSDYGKFFTRTYLICAAYGAYTRRLLCTSTHARHDFLENGKRCPSSSRVIHCQKMAMINRHS